MHVIVAADLIGSVENVSDSVRSNLELFQLSGTSMQTPCATPGMLRIISDPCLIYSISVHPPGPQPPSPSLGLCIETSGGFGGLLHCDANVL